MREVKYVVCYHEVQYISTVKYDEINSVETESKKHITLNSHKFYIFPISSDIKDANKQRIRSRNFLTSKLHIYVFMHRFRILYRMSCWILVEIEVTWFFSGKTRRDNFGFFLLRTLSHP